MARSRMSTQAAVLLRAVTQHWLTLLPVPVSDVTGATLLMSRDNLLVKVVQDKTAYNKLTCCQKFSGSVVFASCCSGPSLNCIRVTSQETGLVRGDQQQVTCPSSYVMVSCAYFAPNGKSGGASIVRESDEFIRY